LFRQGDRKSNFEELARKKKSFDVYYSQNPEIANRARNIRQMTTSDSEDSQGSISEPKEIPGQLQTPSMRIKAQKLKIMMKPKKLKKNLNQSQLQSADPQFQSS
jgi:hypothetical protein